MACQSDNNWPGVTIDSRLTSDPHAVNKANTKNPCTLYS